MLETFTREIALDHLKKPLVIHQQTPSDVGGVVWDGALVLASFISKFKKDFMRDATIVELGTGTGVVGLACATFPAKKVLLTDFPTVRELVEKNIAENLAVLRAPCEFVPLDWSHPEELVLEEEPKMVIASECIYYGDAIKPLVDTLSYLSGFDTRVLISFEFRPQKNHVDAIKEFLACCKTTFVVKEVPLDEQHENYRSDDIKILLLTKKHC
ncbi:methyltransferase protein 21D-like [Tropilaelaps mercedesae]|uniref:Methyltransferase protein 21D-like n=1 Tax=Tropilaelaps mercedesae TaxID=418985 RepID=A0A1V9XEU5_9ACAR|nr:methyltransferase protein 21D-like [Tropilaelaps mercedesae]